MESEHDQAGGVLRELRELTRGHQPPPDACASYRALLAGLDALEQDLHRHIHLENNLLFPQAIALEDARH
jgi:regulator of cell morphogenesis and NO signaling